MKRKINRRLMVTATLAIFSTLLLTVAVCYKLYKNQVLDDLRIYAKTMGYLICQSTEETEENIESSFLGLREKMRGNNVRMTLIEKDGTVVYDTVAEAEKMENHSDRPEVQDAIRKGEGSIIRKSDTLEKSTYYCALMLEDRYILRVSRDAGSIYRVMDYAIPYIVVIVILLLLFCAVVSHYLAEGIIKPIKQIAENVDTIEGVEAYEEMRPYVDAIRNHHDDVIENARIRQEFTANVSHELKTPLTAISGYSELIEKGMVTQEAETKRFAGEIHKNANRLLTLINDVIRLSELDDSETEETFEAVDLWESADKCVNMLQMSAEKHGVSLVMEGEQVTIRANRQMVEEVLYNLCDNAIRYNREHGNVLVKVEAKEDTAVLIVKDTGIGIPAEHQERIFERFYRVDKSRSKSTGGTGLGLAIVKHILIKLNATITLVSEANIGTEITVTFLREKEKQPVG